MAQPAYDMIHFPLLAFAFANEDNLGMLGA